MVRLSRYYPGCVSAVMLLLPLMGMWLSGFTLANPVAWMTEVEYWGMFTLLPLLGGAWMYHRWTVGQKMIATLFMFIYGFSAIGAMFAPSMHHLNEQSDARPFIVATSENFTMAIPFIVLCAVVSAALFYMQGNLDYRMLDVPRKRVTPVVLERVDEGVGAGPRT